VIVRIMGEGQYRLPEESLQRINELDDALEASLDDADAFPSALAALLESVRGVGHPLDADELLASDVVLPAAEATADEVREMLTDEGLIPD
jgi:hypothetical protein